MACSSLYITCTILKVRVPITITKSNMVGVTPMNNNPMISTATNVTTWSTTSRGLLLTAVLNFAYVVGLTRAAPPPGGTIPGIAAGGRAAISTFHSCNEKNQIWADAKGLNEKMDSNADVVFLIGKRAILDASPTLKKSGKGDIPVRSAPFPIRIGFGSDSQTRARQLRGISKVFSEMVPFAEEEVRGKHLEAEGVYDLGIEGVVFGTDDRAEEGKKKLLSLLFPSPKNDSSRFRDMSGAFLRAAVVGSVMSFHDNVLAIDRVVCSNGVYILHNIRPPNSAILSDMLEQDYLEELQPGKETTHVFPFSQFVVKHFIGSIASALACTHRRGFVHGAVDLDHVLMNGNDGRLQFWLFDFSHAFSRTSTRSICTTQDVLGLAKVAITLLVGKTEFNDVLQNACEKTFHDALMRARRSAFDCEKTSRLEDALRQPVDLDRWFTALLFEMTDGSAWNSPTAEEVVRRTRRLAIPFSSILDEEGAAVPSARRSPWDVGDVDDENEDDAESGGGGGSHVSRYADAGGPYNFLHCWPGNAASSSTSAGRFGGMGTVGTVGWNESLNLLRAINFRDVPKTRFQQQIEKHHSHLATRPRPWEYISTRVFNVLHFMGLGSHIVVFHSACSLLHSFLNRIDDFSPDRLPQISRLVRFQRETDKDFARRKSITLFECLVSSVIQLSASLNGVNYTSDFVHPIAYFLNEEGDDQDDASDSSSSDRGDYGSMKNGLKGARSAVRSLKEVIFNTLSFFDFHKKTLFTSASTQMTLQPLVNLRGLVVKITMVATVFCNPCDLQPDSELALEFELLMCGLGKKIVQAPLLKRILERARITNIFEKDFNHLFTSFTRHEFELFYGIRLGFSLFPRPTYRISSFDWLVSQLRGV